MIIGAESAVATATDEKVTICCHP